MSEKTKLSPKDFAVQFRLELDMVFLSRYEQQGYREWEKFTNEEFRREYESDPDLVEFLSKPLIRLGD